MRRLQLVHTARRFTSTFSREATNLGARRWEKEPLSEVLRVLPTKFGEVRIAADAIFEVVLRLAMAREVDGLGLRMQIHHEGNDRCGEIAANVVRNVALAVVLVDLHDLLKQLGHLGLIFLPGLLREKEILIAGHGFAAESGQQVLLGTGTFELHRNDLLNKI